MVRFCNEENTMIGFQVNGKPVVASGSLMIPPNAEAAIQLPGGLLRLEFKVGTPEGYTWDHWKLTITAHENPLGIALDIPLSSSDGSPLQLAMTVHTVGTTAGAGIYRIVHYTAHRR
jgi:hypothetical protein